MTFENLGQLAHSLYLKVKTCGGWQPLSFLFLLASPHQVRLTHPTESQESLLIHSPITSTWHLQHPICRWHSIQHLLANTTACQETRCSLHGITQLWRGTDNCGEMVNIIMSLSPNIGLAKEQFNLYTRMSLLPSSPPPLLPSSSPPLLLSSSPPLLLSSSPPLLLSSSPPLLLSSSPPLLLSSSPPLLLSSSPPLFLSSSPPLLLQYSIPLLVCRERW